MTEIPGMEKPSIHELPQISDRITFLYLERCKLNREDSAITATDEEGVIHIPASAVSALLLGPGTDITHRAMELIGDAGVSVVWVGEHGVRYYAGGNALTHSSGLLERQAKLFANERKHLDVARKMYVMRFGEEENVKSLTMQQLRGREGKRMRAVYRKYAALNGVKWNGRMYDPNNFSAGDPVNQALSAGSVCLYGLAHAVICALGCSPGIGFIHVGHERSFVYDIADLYKAEITIPIAFQAAASPSDELSAQTRRLVRDAMAEKRILERMVKDIKYLLACADDVPEASDPDCGMEPLYLWDDRTGRAAYGRSYKEEP